MKHLQPEIIEESKSFFVLNKPNFWHSVFGKDSTQPNIEEWIQREFPKQSKLKDSGLAHRLDFVTSGCLLVAKTEEAQAEFASLFQSPSNEIQKIYWAITEAVEHGEGEFEYYFSSRYRNSKKVSVKTSGKPSERGRCEWQLLKKVEILSLLEVQLVGPGKRHQIRAGLAKEGMPLIGDTFYGGKNWPESFGLHARSLAWRSKTVICPPPDLWPEVFRTEVFQNHS